MIKLLVLCTAATLVAALSSATFPPAVEIPAAAEKAALDGRGANWDKSETYFVNDDNNNDGAAAGWEEVSPYQQQQQNNNKWHGQKNNKPIKVGILHSQSGTLATGEVPIIDSWLLAIKEINAKGGVLGRQMVPYIEDIESDYHVAAEKAVKLINKGVAVLFGVWGTTARRAVRLVIEKQNILLFYPVQFEGYGNSTDIVYLGMTPNQQQVPAIRFLVNQLGKRRILSIGDEGDGLYSHAATAIAKAQLKGEFGLEFVAEEYAPGGTTDFSGLIKLAREVKADAIFNTLNGDVNNRFFAQMKASGLLDGKTEEQQQGGNVTSNTNNNNNWTPYQQQQQDQQARLDPVPIMSMSLNEDQIIAGGPKNFAGQYVVWDYFSTLATPEARRYQNAFRKEYGAKRVTAGAGSIAYAGVYLWAAACEAAGSIETDAVRRELYGREFDTPSGPNRLTKRTPLYRTSFAHVGRISYDGVIDAVTDSEHAIKPDPYLRDVKWSGARLEQEVAQIGIDFGPDNTTQALAAAFVPTNQQ